VCELGLCGITEALHISCPKAQCLPNTKLNVAYEEKTPSFFKKITKISKFTAFWDMTTYNLIYKSVFFLNFSMKTRGTDVWRGWNSMGPCANQ
jgi:hypothetical protein